MEKKNPRKRKEKLIALEDFIRKLYAHPRDDLDLDSGGHLFSKQGYGNILLNPEEAREYREIVTDIVHTYDKDGLISRKTVERAIQTAIFIALGLGSNDNEQFESQLAEAFKALNHQLNKKTKLYTVFFPVAGAQTKGLPFTFGMVRFAKFNDYQLTKFRKAARHHKVDENQIKDRQFVLDRIKKSENLWNQPCAIVKVQARDQEAAKDLAQREIRDTIDILNFFACLTPYQHGRLYLIGDLERKPITILSLEDIGSFRVNYSQVGPLQAFDFNKFRNEKKLQSVVRRTNHMSRNREVSEVGDYLLKATRWAGRAAIETRREHAFMLYAIALESILLPGGNTEQLGYRLRMRVAHLLEKRIDKRREMAEKVKTLYKIRNQIVHSGWSDLSEKKLDEMKVVCFAVLLRLLSNRSLTLMHSVKELENWFEEKMMR